MPTKIRLRRPTLFAYVGLPASGKSTDARRRVLAAEPGHAVRLNKDDSRDMMHAGRWAGSATEPQIVRARDLLIVDYLTEGIDVYVDDTNLAPTHLRTFAHLAFETGSKFEIVDFTDVALEECIRRDAGRANPVGEAVIRRMASSDLKKKRISAGLAPLRPAPVFDPKLSRVVLCDIDGTLAHMVDRRPYDWAKVGQDAPNAPAIALVKALICAGRKVIVFSGRDAVCEAETRAWLDRYVAPDLELIMRTEKDSRRDSVVKHDLFHTHIAGRYNVEFVIDDRDQVVRTWRSMGLPCFQVATGNF